MRGARSRTLCLLLAGCRRRALPPFSSTWSSEASNSGAATSSRVARRVRWACAGPRCLGGSEATRGEERGTGGDYGAAGEGAGAAEGAQARKQGRKTGAPELEMPAACPGRCAGSGGAHRAGGARGPAAIRRPGLPLNERAAANGSWRRR